MRDLRCVMVNLDPDDGSADHLSARHCSFTSLASCTSDRVRSRAK
jgi:hypothetical protein